MNDLLGLFDLLEEEEKSEKKKPKKSANKKQGKTSKKEKKYALPIYLGAGHLRHLFSDENEKEWSEDMLRIKLGEVFGELQSLSYEIDVIEGELNQDIVSEEVNTFITIYINYTELTEIEKVQFPAEIRLGEIVIPLSHAESFEEIQESLISEYPEYKDCKFHYLEKERYLLKFMSQHKSLIQHKFSAEHDVKKTVVNNESENVFSLIQLIMNQQYDEIYHQVALILQGQSNNAINVLSLLLRNYRLAYKIRTCNCSLKEIGVYGNSYVPRLSAKTCSKSMDIIDDAIRKIKRGYYQQEIALKVVLTKLCALSREG